MAENEKPKPIDYDNLIDELIKKIDNEKSLFTVFDRFGYIKTFYIFFMFFVIYFAWVVLPSVSSFVEAITILIALGAFAFTSISVLVANWKERFIEANFRKAIKKFKIEKKEEEKRLLLNALLKMKATNQNYKLETAKKLNEDLFTKEKLLEKLYE